MAASVSGAKTATVALAPHISASTITTLLALAPENMTLAQFFQLEDAIKRAKTTEHTSSTTLSTLFQ